MVGDDIDVVTDLLFLFYKKCSFSKVGNMGQRVRMLLIGLLLLGAFYGPQNSLAEEYNPFMPDAGVVNAMDIVEMGEPVDSEVLLSLSGGGDMQIDEINVLLNDMKLNAQIGGNVLHSVGTGVNMVSSEAFSSAAGISTVIQNSGNQVVINNAFILNLLVK